MSDKLTNILKIAKNGYPIELASLTIDDYLSKDENGITFIEHLLRENYNFSFQDENKFINNSYIAYLFCKYKKSIHNFKLTEEQLYEEIDGKTFIEFFAENNCLEYNFIKAIKNNVNIVDILLNNNCLYKLSNVDDNIIKMLFNKDSSNKYIIEKYFDDDKNISQIIEAIKYNTEIIDLCVKYNKYELLKKCHEKILMTKISSGKTLFDDLMSKDIIPNKLENLPDNIEFVNFLRKRKLYNYLKDANTQILFTVFNKKTTLLEEILDAGYEPKLNWIFDENNVRTLSKINKLNLISDISANLLLRPAKDFINIKHENIKNSTTLLEYLYSNGYNPLKNTSNINNMDIINYLINNGYINLIREKLNKNIAFEKINENETLIDKLLKENASIIIPYNLKDNKDLLDKIIQYKRFEYIKEFDIKLIIEEHKDGKTYLEYLLESIKNKSIRLNVNKIYTYGLSADQLAKFYLIIAKNDMVNYLNSLDEHDLLKDYNGTTLLESLLKLDPEITIEKLLKEDVKQDPKIATIIKSSGFDLENVNIVSSDELHTKEYLSKYADKLGVGPLPSEGQLLLERLEELFIFDGESDHELVDALLVGYRNSLFEDYKSTLFELNNLILIKENNMDDFFYKKCDSGAYFQSDEKCVYADSPTISTLLHETAHAIHYFLTDYKQPDNYKEIVDKARKDPKVLENTEKYANKYKEIREDVKKLVEKKYEEFFKTYYTENRIKEIEEELKKTKEDKFKEYIQLGIDEDVLETILESTFTKEEYIEHQKRIFIEQYTDAILRTKYGSFLAIGDVLDAIYEGELHNGVLKNKEGNPIPRTGGHGISYYYETHHGFDEMIAQYASIIRSKDSIKNLALLRSIVGDDIVNMIKNFYDNELVLGTYEIEESKTL